eukprot:756712-Rhodomonas_salina.2
MLLDPDPSRLQTRKPLLNSAKTPTLQIKERVAAYLDATFYNLTVRSLRHLLFLQFCTCIALGKLSDIALSTLFDALTFFDPNQVITSHDWQTYAEMRNLAYDKFGLTLIESYLPTGQLMSQLAIFLVGCACVMIFRHGDFCLGACVLVSISGS